MKIEKNKIVFVLVILCVLLFIGAYYMITFSDGENEDNKNLIEIPELEEEQGQYKTKLEALNDLKEEREKTAPSLYPEHMIDDKGYINPDYMEYEKQRIIDSVYQVEQTQYKERIYPNTDVKTIDTTITIALEKDSITEISDQERGVILKELSLEHQQFFTSNPTLNPDLIGHNTDAQIYVRVDGTQTVRKDYRLRMQLTKEANINGKRIPRNTCIYGFVSFKPNRTMVEIENINHYPVNLKAYDLQDGSEGIYIENKLPSEIRQQVAGDAINEINIAGVPQVNGIKRIFQRNNRNMKVTVADNYQMILRSN